MEQFIISVLNYVSHLHFHIHGFYCQQILFFLIYLLTFQKTRNGTKTFYVFVCVWQHSNVQQIADIAKFSILLIIKFVTPIRVVVPSKAGIVGSSLSGGMDVCLWECGVLRDRGPCNELTTRLPTVVRRCLWSRNLVNEEAVVRVGLHRHNGKGKILNSGMRFFSSVNRLFHSSAS
jgi:hypothetical protein